jgi:hypothetical protein
MVVPALSALLPDSARKGLGDVTPVFCAKFQDILGEAFILFLTPWSFDHGGVQNFLPSVEALDISALVQEGGNPFPVPGSKLLN